MRYIVLFAAVILMGVAQAQEPKVIKKIPLADTSPASGKEMFNTYCAVCHGVDGKGGGPAATALKKTPTNLTTLAALHNGKFPENDVAQTLSATTDIDAHGSQEMPIWGALFKSLNSGDRDIVRLRVVNLTYYLKSLQAK